MTEAEKSQIQLERIHINLYLIAIVLTVGLDFRFFEALLKQVEFDNLLPVIAGIIANCMLPTAISRIRTSRATIRRINSTRE